MSMNDACRIYYQYSTVQNIQGTKLSAWFLRFDAYLQMFFLRIVCTAIQFYAGDGHNRETFLRKCYRGDQTTKFCPLNVLYYMVFY